MVVIHTVEDDVEDISQEVPHHVERGVGDYELFHDMEDLRLAPRQNVHGHIDIESLGVGGHRVVSGDLLAYTGDEHPRPGESDGGEGVAGGPAAVRHRGERQPVSLTRHPHGRLAAHVQEAKQHLAHLQVRLPEDKSPANQVYRGSAERSVGRERAGGDEDQVHQRPGGQAAQLAPQRQQGRVLVAWRMEQYQNWHQWQYGEITWGFLLKIK